MVEEKENSVETNIRGKVFIASPPSYNINALYFASIAENLEYEVKLSNYEDSSKVLEEVKVYEPDFLIIKVTFDKFRNQLEFMANIKNILPNTKIIAIGEPFLTYNRNVTYENPFIDYAVFGEAEYTLRDILDGVPDSEIMGICYTDDAMQSVKNDSRPLIENLDDLPIPARHLQNDNSEATIEISRGCPCSCFFCLAPQINGNRIRIRSDEKIIEEIIECKNKYNTKKFYFKSEIFNFDKGWVTNFCKKIIEKKLKIKWSCDIVPYNLDEETVKLMKKSGCRLCKIGIESGSEEILSKIGKNITKESIKNTVSLLKKHGIKTKGYYIIGLPWETEDTAKETTDFAIELDTDDAVFNIGVPFPGTNFFVYAMLNKLFPSQTQFIQAYKNALVRTHDLSKERIVELRDIAENKFYSRPKIIIKSLFSQLLFLKNKFRKFFL